jgi:hypothetical protein
VSTNQRRKTDSDKSESVVLDLRLAQGTPGEAFERLAAAIDAGQVTVAEGKALADILERRLRILDAEKFRQRLEAAEARALEMVRRGPALRAPAARAMVDVDTSKSWEAS